MREEPVPPPLDDPALAAEVRAILDQGRNALAVKRLCEGAAWSVQETFLWIVREQEARDERAGRARKPCPSCGQPLRTDAARQCFACGADWH